MRGTWVESTKSFHHGWWLILASVLQMHESAGEACVKFFATWQRGSNFCLFVCFLDDIKHIKQGRLKALQRIKHGSKLLSRASQSQATGDTRLHDWLEVFDCFTTYPEIPKVCNKIFHATSHQSNVVCTCGGDLFPFVIQGFSFILCVMPPFPTEVLRLQEKWKRV